MSKVTLVGLAVLLTLLCAGSLAHHPAALPSRTVDAPPDSKIVGVLWDQDELYVVVRPMEVDDTPHNWAVVKSSAVPGESAAVTVRESRWSETSPVSRGSPGWN